MTLESRDFGAELAAELPRLSRLALHLVHEPALAEELAQEAALRSWSRRAQLRPDAPIGPWLNRILVNLVIDRARTRHDEFTVSDVEDRWADDDYTVDPERVVARAELRDELEDALVRLPAGIRTVVVLHDALEWTVVEITRSLGIGLPAAKQRLRRGRMMLVTALADGDPQREASLAQPIRCWEARRHVSGYLDAELRDADRRAVEAHLMACPTCPPLYTALVGVRASLGALRDPDSVVPGEIAARIQGRIPSSGASPERRVRRGRTPAPSRDAPGSS